MLCHDVADVVLLIDDDEVHAEAQKFGAIVVKDSTTPFASGTARAAAAVKSLGGLIRDATPIVVWQVDEPEIEPDSVKRLIRAAVWPDVVYTLTCPLRPEDEENPSVVKAIVGDMPEAGADCCVHWFSRTMQPGSVAHVGLYGFSDTSSFVLKAKSRPHSFAVSQSLEQLTWLMNGIEFVALHLSYVPASINTPSDWIKFIS